MNRLAPAIQRRDDGAVAVIAALMAVVLFGVGAMAVDLGNAWSRKRMTQTDADLSALAGASLLPVTDSTSQLAACTRAYTFLAKSGNLPSSDDGSGIQPLLSYCPVLVNGDITFPDSTHIRVVSPKRQVDFGLAGIFGFKNTNVSSVAVATVDSPNVGVLPFIVAAGSAPASGSATVCLKSNSSSKGCGSSSSGNFGYASFPRDDYNSANWLQANTALGVQQKATPILFQTACTYYYGFPANKDLCSDGTGGTPHTSADLECQDPVLYDGKTQIAPSGALTEPSNPTPSQPLVQHETCVQSAPGATPSDLTDALLSWGNSKKSGTCQGRLASATATKAKINGCYVVADTWNTYQNYQGFSGQIDPAILKDPRFGVIPITSVVPSSGGSNSYAILTFYGAYLHAFWDNSNPAKQICGDPTTTCNYKDDIYAVDAYVFPLGSLPKTVPGSSLGTFLGTGPIVPMLDKDS